LEYLFIAITVFLISGIVLFSGFGLGTLLMPVLALFFPVAIAINLTAVVHFLNNLFKLAIVGKYGNKEAVIKFAIPAIPGAIVGSMLLSHIAQKNFIINYQLFSHQFSVQFVNLFIGVLIIFFILLEIIPQLNKISFSKKYLPVGGILSGFFGGLSGHQGVFRSIFLLKTGLSKEQFIATGVIIAIIVDFTRLIVYGTNFLGNEINYSWKLLTVAVFSAFLGSYIARKYIHKVTIGIIRYIIVVLLCIISAGLITGVI